MKTHRTHREKSLICSDSYSLPTVNFISGEWETGQERAKRMQGYVSRHYAWWGYCSCGWTTGPHKWQTVDADIRDHLARRSQVI